MEFLFEVGVIKIPAGKENPRAGISQYFAQELTNDRYQSHEGEEMVGSDVEKLAELVKQRVHETVSGDVNFTWTFLERDANPEDRTRQKMPHNDFAMFMLAINRTDSVEDTTS